MDAETSIQLDHLQKEVTEIKEAVSSIDHAIRGNGQPGLRTRVEKLELVAKRNVGMVNLLISLTAAAAAIFAALK